MPTPHIESKKEDIASIVLMPGDPNRAEYIATNFLENVKLVNKVRGMRAYTGEYKGKKITIFPSGMGNPSVGIYSYELYTEYNVDTIIRIGTVGAYLPELNLGDIILADNSISDSSFAKVSNNYNSNTISASIEINNHIFEVSNNLNINIKRGNIFCSDVFYKSNNNYKEKILQYNVMGEEMESFGLYHTAKMLSKNASTLLTVSNSFCFKDEMSSEDREKSLNNMIKLALESSLKL
jgi:purine-nucleoside phosphorylase